MFVDYQTLVIYIFNPAVAVTIGLPDEQFWAGYDLSQVQKLAVKSAEKRTESLSVKADSKLR